MIEIMVAMVLAAIAIIGILALYMAQTRAAGFSRHSTEATVLAQDKIEQLRAQGTAATIATTTEANINERGKAGGIFTRVYSETLTLNYAAIAVTVTWSDEGSSHFVSLQAKRDL